MSRRMEAHVQLDGIDADLASLAHNLMASLDDASSLNANGRFLTAMEGTRLENDEDDNDDAIDELKQQSFSNTLNAIRKQWADFECMKGGDVGGSCSVVAVVGGKCAKTAQRSQHSQPHNNKKTDKTMAVQNRIINRENPRTAQKLRSPRRKNSTSQVIRRFRGRKETVKLSVARNAALRLQCWWRRYVELRIISEITSWWPTSEVAIKARQEAAIKCQSNLRAHFLQCQYAHKMTSIKKLQLFYRTTMLRREIKQRTEKRKWEPLSWHLIRAEFKCTRREQDRKGLGLQIEGRNSSGDRSTRHSTNQMQRFSRRSRKAHSKPPTSSAVTAAAQASTQWRTLRNRANSNQRAKPGRIKSLSACAGGFGPVGAVRICAIHSPTPASRCGMLRVGDLILEVNNENVTKMSMAKVRRALATKTAVMKLVIKRQGKSPSGRQGDKSASKISPPAKVQPVCKVQGSPIRLKRKAAKTLNLENDNIARAPKLNRSRTKESNGPAGNKRNTTGERDSSVCLSPGRLLGKRSSSASNAEVVEHSGKSPPRKCTPPPTPEVVRGAQQLLATLCALRLQAHEMKSFLVKEATLKLGASRRIGLHLKTTEQASSKSGFRNQSTRSTYHTWVSKVVPNSPAGRCQKISPGDVLVGVMGKDIRRLPIAEVVRSFLSAQTVNMTFLQARNSNKRRAVTMRQHSHKRASGR